MTLRTGINRIISTLTIFLLMTASASADISVGSWIFDDLAFADEATQIDAGTIEYFCGATDLDDALTGYSPEKLIVNIGGSQGSNANLFQLDFIDLTARNDPGGDIVFFEARFSIDPFEIAVRPEGGGFTTFIDYPAEAFVDTGIDPCGQLWGVEIDLDDFGIGAGVIVDAIRFSALRNLNGGLDGDPVMAAVLNASTPVDDSSWSTVKALYR